MYPNNGKWRAFDTMFQFLFGYQPHDSPEWGNKHAEQEAAVFNWFYYTAGTIDYSVDERYY